MTAARIILLGTGSSGGVPRAGGDWGACDPSEPRNRRRRCSALVEKAGPAGASTRILIDTSPDLREQLLDANVTHLDAVVYTHDHADQTHGIDDVRALVIKARRALPVYFDAYTCERLFIRFRYCFFGEGGYPAILCPHHTFSYGKPFHIEGAGGAVEFLPFEMEHGQISCAGFRIGDVAYCNDVNGLPPAARASLMGLDTLIIDALRHTPHPSHAHLAQTLEWIEELKPARAVLTNLHIDMDYQALKRSLPAHVEPGFDGMEIMIAGA